MCNRIMMNYLEAIENYCDELIITSGDVSPSRNQHVKTALTFLHKLNPNLDWETMTTREAKEIYGKFVKSELAETTRALRSRYILNFFKYLAEEKINENLDIAIINKMKAHRSPAPVIDEQEILTEEQLKSLIKQNLPQEMKVIISCLFGAGMRISEVLRLRPADVILKYEDEFQRPYFRISVDDQKTQKRRTTFVVLPYLMEILMEHSKTVKPTDKYFVNLGGEQIHYSYVRYWFDKERAKFPKLTSHKGRKFNISHRIANGESPSTVCLTTHGTPSSPSINHYLRLNERDAIRGIMRNES